MLVDELQTPCVIVDLDILENNIDKMANFCRSKKCGLRPHAKSHKSPLVARKQLRAGALGVCCQTMEEAEAMVMSGIDNVLLTHYLASDSKVERFLNLCKHSQVMVTVDGAEVAKILSKAADHRRLEVDVLVEIDIGNKRTGQQPGEPATKFAQFVSQLPALNFRGLMAYEGHLQLTTPNFEKRKERVNDAMKLLTQTIESVKKTGLEIDIVTSGGTGTYNITSEYPGVTEIQPGSYTVMDYAYSKIDTCGSDFGRALTVLSTVVSTPSDDRAVVDLGWKSFSVEYELSGLPGLPVPHVNAKYNLAGDEHGILQFEDPSKRLRVGDRVFFTPGHCDTTLNLHGKFYAVRGDRVELTCPVARR